MPRRRVISREQLDELLALPATEAELIRYWTLSAADLAAVERRRGDPISSASRCNSAPSATPVA
jgi:Domain of unknown function (DUF4158)